jgi:hypothetical protein
MKKKIKIGYEDIAINVINFTTNDKKDDNVLGEYDSSNAKIDIQKDQNARSEANTLLHEVIQNFDLRQRDAKLYDYNSCLHRDPFATLPISHFPHPVSWPAVLNKIITHPGLPSRQQEAVSKIIKK